MKSTSLLAILLIIVGSFVPKDFQWTNHRAADMITIAFGSCSNQNKEQKLWDDILAEQPDIFIWLGDNIYGDSEDMQVLKKKYDKQKAHSLYQKLRESTQILGTWDDHDYGANDAGKEYPMKAESQQLLLDFLEVPEADARRQRPGVYSSQIVEKSGVTIKIILLDTRYFRDNLVKKGKANIANWEGEILGTAQWQWLETELQNSEADVHIIGSSIQVLAEEHRFEKWANFPLERQKLLNLIAKYDIKNSIFISGDRHIGEVATTTWLNHTIYEVTSSSLTHGWSNRREEANQYRLGPLVYNENYGLINITATEDLEIELFLKSDERQIEMQEVASFRSVAN
ncbi:MAG: alkaline phosphatase D family protein [Bacteroidota bacterium]